MRKFQATVLCAGVAASLFAMPVQSAVIDQVQNKVDAIKNETSIIKSKVNDVVKKLDPLSMLDERFAEFGFDPREFLEMIPAEQIQQMMDQIRTQQAEARDMLNDPGIEAFRDQFIETLKGISQLVSKNGAVEVTPFQTLVENAPDLLVATLKSILGPQLQEINLNVQSGVESISQLRALGLMDPNADLEAILNGLDQQIAAAAFQPSQRGQSRWSGSQARYFQRVGNGGVDWRDVHDTACWVWNGPAAAVIEGRLLMVKQPLKFMIAKMESLSKRFDAAGSKNPLNDLEVKVWGWVGGGLKLNEGIVKRVDVMKADLELILTVLENHEDRLSYSQKWCDVSVEAVERFN
jgi:hypothetical protein